MAATSGYDVLLRITYDSMIGGNIVEFGQPYGNVINVLDVWTLYILRQL